MRQGYRIIRYLGAGLERVQTMAEPVHITGTPVDAIRNEAEDRKSERVVSRRHMIRLALAAAPVVVLLTVGSALAQGSGSYSGS